VKSASTPYCPREKVPNTHRVEDWVDTRVGLDPTEKKVFTTVRKQAPISLSSGLKLKTKLTEVSLQINK